MELGHHPTILGRRATSLGKGRPITSVASILRRSSFNTADAIGAPLTYLKPLQTEGGGRRGGGEGREEGGQVVGAMAEEKNRRARRHPSMRRMVPLHLPSASSSPDVDPAQSPTAPPLPATAGDEEERDGTFTNESNSGTNNSCNNSGDERSASAIAVEALPWQRIENETTAAVAASWLSAVVGVEAATQTRFSSASSTSSASSEWISFSGVVQQDDLQVQSVENDSAAVPVSRFAAMPHSDPHCCSPDTLPDTLPDSLPDFPAHPLQSSGNPSAAVDASTTVNSSDVTERQRGRAGRNRDGRTHSHSRARRHRSSGTISSGSTSGRSHASTSDDVPIVRPHRRRRSAESNVDPEEESRRKKTGIWPHNLSALFALLATTIGLFNISRFALLSIEYGGTFVVQFVLLSFIFGIPLICFHGCIGQFLGSNVIDMWRISPIFKGVGISLLVAQAILGLYSIVGIAWMFFYFRDSFIAQEDRYKWTKCYDQIRGCMPPTNYSFSLEDTIPDYFQARVLQRSSTSTAPLNFMSLKFEIAFNLAVIWMLIFVALGKGLRSYGKVVYAFGTLPLLGYFVVCVKILSISSSVPSLGVGGVLEMTPWNEFFTDTRVWVIAAREVFLTWGVCGAMVMQITSHNRYGHSLRRDITIVIVVTLFVLMLSAFLASACIQIINFRGHFTFVSSSFETDRSFRFLKANRYNRPHVNSFPTNHHEFHNNLLMGIAVRGRDSNPNDRSGYQPLRLATELFPALVAVIGPNYLSPFWSVIFYFSLVAFGIGQQLVIWQCVISGIVAFRTCCLKSWETTITFCTCLLGFAMSLPLATELGISIVYHMDYAFGSLWWLMMIHMMQLAAVLVVRGRPYNGDSIVAVFIKGSGCLANWCVPLLTFSWSVILPVALLFLSVILFRTGNFCDMFTWRMTQGYIFWPLWARQAGTMIQLIPLLVVPTVGLIQSVRYLTSGPEDLFERIKLLYRPPFRTYIIPNTSQRRRNGHDHRSVRATPSSLSTPSSPVFMSDPPPKYTPPPTYNTATGARIAKLFRESIRRSIRQIRGLASAVTILPVAAPSISISSGTAILAQPAEQNQNPPAYTSVIMEMQLDSTVSSSSDSAFSEEIDGSLSQLEATTSSSSSSQSFGDSPATPPRLSHLFLLRESIRRSVRNIIQAKKTEPEEEAGEISDSDANLVAAAASIHRDPSLSSIVVNLPNCGFDNSESNA